MGDARHNTCVYVGKITIKAVKEAISFPLGKKDAYPPGSAPRGRAPGRCGSPAPVCFVRVAWGWWVCFKVVVLRSGK